LLKFSIIVNDWFTIGLNILDMTLGRFFVKSSGELNDLCGELSPPFESGSVNETNAYMDCRPAELLS
jgi:hypothetical protein